MKEQTLQQKMESLDTKVLGDDLLFLQPNNGGCLTVGRSAHQFVIAEADGDYEWSEEEIAICKKLYEKSGLAR